MIISINGRVYSGKDTVAKIIQRLQLKQLAESGEIGTHNVPSLSQLGKIETVAGSSWQIKKFAGKLKQILSALTGIPLLNFESQEYKANYVINMMTLKVSHVGEVDSYLDSQDIPLVRDMVAGKQHNINITIRVLLQVFGTDIMRFWFPEVWVNALFVDYRSSMQKVAGGECGEGMPDWVITDMRFTNEFVGAEERGAFMVRVEKGDFILNDPKLHISETALDNHYYTGKFNWILRNNGSLEYLEEQVIEMLKHAKKAA